MDRLIRLPRYSWGMSLGHFGLALAIAGMAGAGGWTKESIQPMRPGETVNVSGYKFSFQGAEIVRGPNYTSVVGNFVVTRNGKKVTRSKRNSL